MGLFCKEFAWWYASKRIRVKTKKRREKYSTIAFCRRNSRRRKEAAPFLVYIAREYRFIQVPLANIRDQIHKIKSLAKRLSYTNAGYLTNNKLSARFDEMS
jgi:hypothetical protein